MHHVSPPAPFRMLCSTTFPELLRQLNMTLLVSTYQAGKVITFAAEQGTLRTEWHEFQTPMGLAFDGGNGLAIGTKSGVFTFHEPAASGEGSFQVDRGHNTGEIAIHDIAWAGDELWIVNTRFSCLCTLEERYHFRPRWQPPFVSALVPEDRCHLNGLAIRDGVPRYVTAHGQTDSLDGWRQNKSRGGILMDVVSGRMLATGLSMPHSPRWHDDQLWFLDSGAGSLSRIDPDTGRIQLIANLPGFTRGLDFHGPFAFIGLSQVRKSAIFGGLPITDRLPVEQRVCGICVVDTQTGQTVASLRFQSGVEEIFGVQIVPGIRHLESIPAPLPIAPDGFRFPGELIA